MIVFQVLETFVEFCGGGSTRDPWRPFYGPNFSLFYAFFSQIFTKSYVDTPLMVRRILDF